MDNRFARTFTQLWVNPKEVIESYLKGNRVRYIGPLAYLIIMSALYILSFDLFGVSIEEYMGTAADSFQTGPRSQNQQEFMQAYIKTFSDNMRVVVGSMIPFMSLSLLIFYRRRNYLENFLLVSYAIAQAIWLSIFGLALLAITGGTILWVNFLVNMIYACWVFGQLHAQKSKTWTYTKAILSWIVGYIFFTVTISIIAVAVLFITMAKGG